MTSTGTRSASSSASAAIDRIGSPNERIQLVNFWPNIELEEYINLEQRVSGRMVLLDISATGEENLIEQDSGNQMNDLEVPLRDRCSFGRFSMANKSSIVSDLHGWRTPSVSGEELGSRKVRPTVDGGIARGLPVPRGLNSQRGFGPAVEPRRKSRPRSTSLHGSSPCKCQRLSTLRWDRLPPSRPSTKSGARAGGRRLSDRRLHRWLAGTSASAPSSHGAADLLGLNRAHICVRNRFRVPPQATIEAPGRGDRA